MFSTRIRADSSFPCYLIWFPGQILRLVVIIVVKRGGECGVHSNTSSSCAIARRCCLARAVSFCWTIRSRLIDSLSCTLILDCGHCGEHSLKENSVDGGEHTTIDDEGAMIRVYRYFSTDVVGVD